MTISDPLVGTFGVHFLGWSYFGVLEGGTNHREGHAVMASVIAVFAIVGMDAIAFLTGSTRRLDAPA